MTELTQPRSKSVTVWPIQTEADYEAALAEIDRLFNAEPGTREDERLEVLITLVQAYEDEYYPMGETSDPISMIEHVLEAQGLTRKDLESYIGPRQRVWEIMEKQRRLTLPMIRRLEAGLRIPADLLIREYELKPKNGSTSAHKNRIKPSSRRPIAETAV